MVVKLIVAVWSYGIVFAIFCVPIAAIHEALPPAFRGREALMATLTLVAAGLTYFMVDVVFAIPSGLRAPEGGIGPFEF